MSDIKIIDNFLEKEISKNIKKILHSSYFPWYFNFGVNNVNDGYFQFVHNFYQENAPQSDYIKILNPILEKLNIFSLIRIKANLITITPKLIEHGMHQDYLIDNLKTAIYYVNTNNGYTVFEDETKINSIENRIAIFKTNKLHSGSSCTDKNTRIVINFNYIENKI
jgi:hypothetical protein